MGRVALPASRLRYARRVVVVSAARNSRGPRNVCTFNPLVKKAPHVVKWLQRNQRLPKVRI